MGVPKDGEFSQVELGDRYGLRACGLRADGVVVCWGEQYSRFGQALRVGSSDSPSEFRWELRLAEGPAGAEGFTDIVVGSRSNVCGVRDDATAACWNGRRFVDVGAPEGGQALWVDGNPVCELSPDGGFECSGGGPAQALPEGEFADVSIGLGSGCGVRVGGELVCWGDNEHGQADPPDGQYTQVSLGGNKGCAVAVGGHVVCWGGNPIWLAAVPGGEFTQVEAAGQGSCGLRVGGELVCWGWSRPADRPFLPDGSFTEVAMGNGTLVCGLRDDRTVSCWMPNGQKFEVPEGEFTQVAAMYGGVCGLRPDDTAQCWKPLDGLPVPAPKGAFAQIPDGARPDDSCWLRLDRTAQCWQRDRALPAVPDGTFDEITAGGRCGVLADTGEVTCWTSYMTGLVGAPPLGVLPLARVSAGGGVFCGISAADNSLVCWPRDSQAAIDLGDGFGGEFADVSVAPNGSFCAVRADYTLVCQGLFSDAGPLSENWVGIGSFYEEVEDIVAPEGEFARVEVGLRHACAIGVDGSVVCWGNEHDPPVRYVPPCDQRTEDCPA